MIEEKTGISDRSDTFGIPAYLSEKYKNYEYVRNSHYTIMIRVYIIEHH